MAPSSALPIGSAAIVTELKPIKVDPGIPGSGLLNTVLALLSPVPHQAGTLISEELSDEEILECDVTGFLIMYVAQHSSHPSFTHSPPRSGLGTFGIFCYNVSFFHLTMYTTLFNSPHVILFHADIRRRSAAIDIPNRKMTILSPLPGSLAGRIAVAGSFEWQDQ